eukprot:3650243-Rhodomonas_salina.14
MSGMLLAGGGGTCGGGGGEEASGGAAGEQSQSQDTPGSVDFVPAILCSGNMLSWVLFRRVSARARTTHCVVLTWRGGCAAAEGGGGEEGGGKEGAGRENQVRLPVSLAPALCPLSLSLSSLFELVFLALLLSLSRSLAL